MLNFGLPNRADKKAPQRKRHQLILAAQVSATIAAASLLASCTTSGHAHSRAIISGNQAALQGDYLEATKFYETAIDELPESLPAQRNLGIVLVKSGDFHRSLEALKKVYPHYKSDVEVQYYLGESYRGLKNFMQASEHYQLGLRIDPSDLRLIKALGWTWHKMNQNAWTINLLTPYLATERSDHQIRLILANSLNASKDHKKAADLLSFVLDKRFKIKSKDLVSAQAEKMLLLSTLAESFIGMNDCKRAQSLLAEVLQIRPFFDQALVSSAECYLRERKSTLALRALERAVKANPTSWKAHFFLARALDGKERERAKFYYSRFLNLVDSQSDIAKDEKGLAKRALARLKD